MANRLTKERVIVFCTSRSVDKSKAMTGSMKASGKGDFTETHKAKNVLLIVVVSFYMQVLK